MTRVRSGTMTTAWRALGGGTVMMVLALGCAPRGPDSAVVELAVPLESPPISSAGSEDTTAGEPPPERAQTPPRSEAPSPTPDPDQETRGKAREHFREGLEAYNLSDYARAREHFRAAYDLVPERALLFNIASCEIRMGNTSVACGLFRQYVNTGDPSDPRIQDVQRQVSAHCRGVP